VVTTWESSDRGQRRSANWTLWRPATPCGSKRLGSRGPLGEPAAELSVAVGQRGRGVQVRYPPGAGEVVQVGREAVQDRAHSRKVDGNVGGVWPVAGWAQVDRGRVATGVELRDSPGLAPELFSGHSLRSGFATTAARGGVAEHEIMRQGGWNTSQGMWGYIQEGELFVGNPSAKLGIGSRTS
jgi:hypothetical protein